MTAYRKAWPSVTFVAGGEPVAWERARVGRAAGTGKVVHFTGPRTAGWENTVGWAARNAMVGRQPLIGPLFAMLTFRLAVPVKFSKRMSQRAYRGEIHPGVRPDIDNYTKAVLDACNGIVWKDDGQVVGLLAVKAYWPEPGCLVEVVPMEAAEEFIGINLARGSHVAAV